MLAESRADDIVPNDGTFHQSWYPLLLASELPPGAVRGIDAIGTRLVVYRGTDGQPVVQSAYCPHLGADLSLGSIVEGRLRCVYHHWSFDGSGHCVHIPSGDKIPPSAKIGTYPAAEAWGLIWFFNGEHPLFPPPSMPETREDELVFQAYERGERNVEPWIGVSNGVDFQHLRALHGIQMETPETLTSSQYHLEWRVETGEYEQHGLITGTNCFSQKVRSSSATPHAYMMFAGVPTARGTGHAFYVVGLKAPKAAAVHPEILARMRTLGDLAARLLGEDEPVLNSMRFRRTTLVAADRYLSRFFKYVATFPRTAPLDA